MADRDDILRRVQALINKADSTTFDEERDSYLAKADELMFRYAIESYEMDSVKAKANRKEQIVKREVVMIDYDAGVAAVLIDLMASVAAHARCRVVFSGAYKFGKVKAILIGFESDTEYCEMLYTSLWLQMTNHLEPKPDPELSDAENIVMLLEAGQKRERVCQLLGWDYQKDHGKVSKIYKDYCAENGISYQPRSRPTGSVYAVNFAQGFKAKVSQRLYEIRAAQMETVEGGTTLALRGRDQEVKDAMREMFPRLGAIRARAEAKFNETARARGTQAGAEADLSQTRGGGKRKELS